MAESMDVDTIQVDLKSIATTNADGTKTAQKDPLKSFLSGGAGGMSLVLVGHPLDLIKVRMQTSSQYGSMMEAFRSIMAADGPRGLYRGMMTPLIGITPIFAVCFWGYDLGHRLAKRFYDTQDLRRPLPDGSKRLDEFQTQMVAAMFAGGFSALPTTLIMTPSERIKVMLQIQGSQASAAGKVYSGPVDVVRSVGLRNLYKGTVATLARDVPGSIAYFAAYEATKHWMTQYLYRKPVSSDSHAPEVAPTLPILAILTAGGLAGWANWIVAIPADVIKSRIQAGASQSGWAILKSLLREEGISALFKGLGPALVRSFPANAACFLGVEVSMNAMNQLW